MPDCTLETKAPNPDLPVPVENLLDPVMSKKLTEIRGMRLSFHEKAAKYAEFLKAHGCSDVVRIECDVCVDAYLPEGQSIVDVFHAVFGDRRLYELSDEEKEVVFAEIDNRLPEECKVRVHAVTPQGYHTFCFDCDSTMCGNEVDYPGNPNWDELHDKEAQDFLRQHPELGIERYMLSGSTRRYICLSALTEDPDKEGKYLEFSLPGDKKLRIDYSSAKIINMIGQEAANKILKNYRPLL